mgnify:CR=1 FL=1
MFIKKILLAPSIVASSIFFALAQGTVTEVTALPPTAVAGNNALLGILAVAQTIVARLVPFLVGLAVLAFFWFLIIFIWKGQSSPDEQRKSLAGMGYSLLAIFVMVSIWGIIGFMGSIFGISQGGSMPGFRLPGE